MTSCFLTACDTHTNCVVYSYEPSSGTGWESHLPDDSQLLSRLNGSFDTFDRRDNTVLTTADYPDQLAQNSGADGVLGTSDDTSTRSWWKPWAR
jgi:hypothetical protein